jgi:hypothetical protein
MQLWKQLLPNPTDYHCVARRARCLKLPCHAFTWRHRIESSPEEIDRGEITQSFFTNGIDTPFRLDCLAHDSRSSSLLPAVGLRVCPKVKETRVCILSGGNRPIQKQVNGARAEIAVRLLIRHETPVDGIPEGKVGSIFTTFEGYPCTVNRPWRALW